VNKSLKISARTIGISLATVSAAQFAYPPTLTLSKARSTALSRRPSFIVGHWLLFALSCEAVSDLGEFGRVPIVPPPSASLGGLFHATLHLHQVIAGIVLMAAVAMVQRAQVAVEPL